MRTATAISTLLSVTLVAGAFAQAPDVMPFQINLTDSTGAPVTDSVALVFEIYDLETGGLSLWGPENHAVLPDNGIASVLLGAGNPAIPLSPGIFDGSIRYLAVTVEGTPLDPRLPIGSSAYAYSASNADRLDGQHASAFADWTISGSNVYRSTGNVGIGTSSPGAKLQVQGDATHHVSTQVSSRAYHEFRSGANTWEAGLNFSDSGFWYMITYGSNDYLQIHTSGIMNLYCDPVYFRTVYGNGISGTTRDLYITSAGELGYLTSSLRYKENVRPLDEYSERIYGLRPVVFDYKGDETAKNRFGLIAEEVEESMPELVGYDEEGRVDTVSYDQLVPLILNEVIQLREQNERLAERVRRLEGDLTRSTR
jgi:hypothetical protein